MKSRTGFVSNSSSCSFVLIMKESDREKFYDSIDPIQSALMKRFEERGEDVFLGETVITFTGEIGYIDEDGPDGMFDEVGSLFTNEELEDLSDYYNDETPAHKKFEKIFGYRPCLSEAFDKIELPEDSFYKTVDS